jgi:hypothetical protein
MRLDDASGTNDGFASEALLYTVGKIRIDTNGWNVFFAL